MSLTIEEHLAQATALHEQQLPEKALAHLDQILVKAPNHIPALRLRAFSLLGLNKLAESLVCYQQLLSLNNQDIDALIKCGRICLFLKQPQNALAYFDTAITIEPNNVRISALRGNAFTALKRPKAAAACYAHALTFAPDDIGLLVNYGCVLYELTDYAQALACFEKIMSINPNHLLGLSYSAFCLVSFNRHIEAMANYEKAIQINPNHAITQFNESLCRLVMGDYKIGWQKHEWRWISEMAHVNRGFTQPLWLGDADLTNKTILLYAEQGFGDTMHFIRYVPMVKALGAHVIVEAQRELIPFINTIGGIDQIFSQGEDLPETDYRCPLMSLPLAFGTELHNIPTTIPYLFSDANLVQQWREKLSHLSQPYKIGITWSGNLANKTNTRRAITLEEILKTKPDNVDFISLQKRILPEELSLLNEHGIAHFTNELTDFNQTAALVECLDLVITVDTSVAHVAGAMGKPLWILLAFSADWRWLLNRNDSPWYPTATLFRQHAMWDWSKVVDAVKEKLMKFSGKP
jgi:hypothetical protein